MSVSFQTELDELIRARYALLYVVTWEERRARRLVAKIATKQKKSLHEWSLTEGLRRLADPRESSLFDKHAEYREPDALLQRIYQAEGAGIYLLKDFHVFLDKPEVIRRLRDLEEALRRSRKTIVFLSPTLTIPRELEKSFTIVDLPLPRYEDLSELLNHQIAGPNAARQFDVRLNAQEREAIVKAAQGLTMAEAENAFARAIVRDNALDADDIETVQQEKIQIIRKSGLLDYYAADQGLDALGGMDVLKDWLNKRVRAFTQEARDYGLPQPRGILLLGVQGCGKSLVAKTTAAAWRLPLLRMDMSRIFQGYIGSSEENMRRALIIAESLAPVVLWLDEIEKAFSGMGGSGESDAGTTARVIGQFLTWMQEKQEPVFVVATSNNIRGLPPELLRKGRLDEIFFVDLPRSRERAEIVQIHLRRVGRKPRDFDLAQLVEAAEGFSGAEIEQAIISALYDSFFAERELETQDLFTSLHETVPLSQTMRESIQELRAWAADRARPVSSVQGRNLRETA